MGAYANTAVFLPMFIPHSAQKFTIAKIIAIAGLPISHIAAFFGGKAILNFNIGTKEQYSFMLGQGIQLFALFIATMIGMKSRISSRIDRLGNRWQEIIKYGNLILGTVVLNFLRLFFTGTGQTTDILLIEPIFAAFSVGISISADLDDRSKGNWNIVSKSSLIFGIGLIAYSLYNLLK